MADTSNKANLIAKILFIAGGILLFIVLVMFIFKLVPAALSGLANMGSGLKGLVSKEKIEIITESDTVEVQTPIALSFEYTEKEPGQYFISYNCIDGFFFDIQSKDGPKRIVCDVPFKLGTNLSTISLVPIFTDSNEFADTLLTISYKDKNGNDLATGEKTLTIEGQPKDPIAEENPYNEKVPLAGSKVVAQPLTTKAPATTQTQQVNPSKDLAVTYIASIDSQSALVMHVYNFGNTPTGSWEFSYTDAENPSRTVLSPIQASLGAGQGLAITVRFDGQDNSRQTVNVVADPQNKINESNEANNTANVIVTGSSNSNDDDDSNDDSYNRNDDADLVITSLEIGRISGNRFVEDDEIDENDDTAVRFVVKNQGGESTGSWRFEIDNLPYDNNDDTYRSSSNSSLQPGQSREIIAEFDRVDEGRYSIRIEVDSDDDVDEEDERNNTESETFEVNN